MFCMSMSVEATANNDRVSLHVFVFVFSAFFQF